MVLSRISSNGLYGLDQPTVSTIHEVGDPTSLIFRVPQNRCSKKNGFTGTPWWTGFETLQDPGLTWHENMGMAQKPQKTS